MSKYIPTPDDMYSTKPCFICGRDVLDENRETCSFLCRQQKEDFNEDYSWWLWKDYESWPDE